MRFHFLFIFLLFCIGASGQEDVNLFSYNIRYNNPSDGKNSWDNRKDDVAALIQFYDADVVGAQEVRHVQLNDLLNRMSGYGFVGVGRDDGKQQGEYAPIFYRTAKFELEDSGHFWLSRDDTKPNKGWDAVCVRICTWAKLKRRSDQQSFYVFNTHFDHVGKKAQQNSAKLIIRKMGEFAEGKLPIVLTGDFNLTPDDKAIKYIGKHINDSREVSKMAPFGPEQTFNAFKYGEPLISRIDYVFVSNEIEVVKYGVLTDSKDQRYYSDHFPVMTILRF